MLHSADKSTNSIPFNLIEQSERAMRICNACRYCEGFCAVFPALERRTEFKEPDINYLSNLCHDCGECYYCCPYAPPHEFELNFPKILAEVRRETYRKYAWPGMFKNLFNRNGLSLLIGALLAPIVVLLSIYVWSGGATLSTAYSVEEGSFYRVVPHTVMIGIFGAIGSLVVLAFAVGLIRFWRDMGEPLASLLNVRAVRRAKMDAFSLRYLNGGGDGCAYPDEMPSHARRWFHHLTFYGFGLCFGATTVAAVYHNVLGYEAPYPFWSVPVVLGTVGGAGLLVGPLGLLWLKTVRNPELADRGQTGLDITFLVMLFLTSLTGFLLLIFRESAAMGVILAVHLGIVLGLFVTFPYGKMVHGIYRFAALARNALEEQGHAAWQRGAK